MTESVVRLRGTIVSVGQGNTLVDWDDPDTLTLAATAVAPRTSAEENDNRDAVIVGLTVYLTPGSDVVAADRMTVRGVDYEVVGEPGDYRNPYDPSIDGMQVDLERVAG